MSNLWRDHEVSIGPEGAFEFSSMLMSVPSTYEPRHDGDWDRTVSDGDDESDGARCFSSKAVDPWIALPQGAGHGPDAVGQMEPQEYLCNAVEYANRECDFCERC